MLRLMPYLIEITNFRVENGFYIAIEALKVGKNYLLLPKIDFFQILKAPQAEIYFRCDKDYTYILLKEA